MESLLKSYNLNNKMFHQLMKSTGAIIAGSAALSAFNEVYNCVDNFTPDDIDIWVYSYRHKERTTDEDFENNALIYHTCCCAFELYFLNNGYTYSKISDRQRVLEYTDGKLSKINRKIMRFENTDGKKVQVIHTTIPVMDAIKTFDLSICATWCNFYSCDHDDDSRYYLKLCTLNSNCTLRKIMYLLREDLTDREKQRIAKYQSRGYTLSSDITESKCSVTDIFIEL